MHYVKDFYYITDDKREIKQNVVEVEKLLKQSYWANKRALATIKKSIEQSLCYGVFETSNNKLIGFARVVTDFSTMYYLTDVIVDNTYRGKGIGKCLLEQIIKDDKLAGLYSVLLTKDAETLYEKFGFVEAMETCLVKL